MSGPWENYGGAPTAAPPQATGPANAPMATSGPWNDYAPPAADHTTAADDDGMHTYQTMHGKDVVQFRAPADANDDQVRSLAAQATGSNIYLRSQVQRGKAAPPAASAQPDPGVATSVWEGVKNMALMHGGDEIQAAGGGLGSLLSGRGWSSGYDDELAKARATSQAAYDQHGTAFDIGGALGFLPSLALPGGRAAQVENALGRTAALSGVGAAYGGTSAALGADKDRLAAGEEGAGVGAVLGPMVPGALNAGADLVRRFAPGAARLGDRAVNFLAGNLQDAANAAGAVGRKTANALDTIVSRAPQNPDNLAAAAAARTAVGVRPTLANVLDEQGAGTLRAAGQRGDARGMAVANARASRTGLPDAVSAQAANIAPESTATNTMVDNINARRGAMADQQYDAIRDTPVPVTDDLKKVLDTGAGRKALQSAVATSDSPEEVAGFLTGLKRSNEPSEMDRMMSLLPEGMAPAAKAQVQAQLEKQGVKGAPDTPTFTLDMLDRVKRGLQAAQRTPDASGLSRQYQKMVGTLVDHGDAAAPGYAAARGNFAEQSGLADAAEIGANAFKGNADDSMAALRGLSADPTMQPATGVGPVGPSERYVGQVAGRRAIDLAAGDGSKKALATADSMAYAPNSLNRLTALTDAPTARRVQSGMQIVAEDARRSNFLDPNAGSKTASLGEDMGRDLAEGAASLAMGHHAGFVHRIVKKVLNSGIREGDANQLWNLATDPSRTSDAIDYLVRRGASQASARQAVRSLAARGSSEIVGGSAGGSWR